ncbi:Ras-related protein Ral-A [Trichinella patagoniensis]|uniref:Ras-related protein Ral-A n=1 Tax=Trichinella patagoniensis TaxID=990121 RepID=A0A0V1A8P4_9BILA|nr:Ras-related protein Ral-A [Trichinella patagoniensis]
MRNSDLNIPILLVSNKSNLNAESRISVDQAQQRMANLNFNYIETSANSRSNVVKICDCVDSVLDMRSHQCRRQLLKHPAGVFPHFHPVRMHESPYNVNIQCCSVQDVHEQLEWPSASYPAACIFLESCDLICSVT